MKGSTGCISSITSTATEDDGAPRIDTGGHHSALTEGASYTNARAASKQGAAAPTHAREVHGVDSTVEARATECARGSSACARTRGPVGAATCAHRASEMYTVDN